MVRNINNTALQSLYESVKKTNQRVDNLASMLDSFETKDNVKDSVRKSTAAGKKSLEDECDKILNRLKELEMKTNKKISEFENITKEVEKKTLWKITECESSLTKKITPEYVEKALEQFQGKIINDISNNKNQQLN